MQIAEIGVLISDQSTNNFNLNRLASLLGDELRKDLETSQQGS